MARVRYVVHGRGRGHATRARAVISHLRDRGHQVAVAGGRDALPVLREADGDDVEEAPSLTPDMGALRTLRGVISRVSSERLALARDTTEVVVSDGDMPSVLAARLLGCPSIAIGHGIVFSHGRPPAGVSADLWRREARKARLASWGSTRQVAVNFMPIEAAEETVTIARPEVRSELRRAEPDGTVLAYFRDDNGEAVLRALVSAGERPLLFSDAPCAIEGVEVRPRDPKAFTAALCGARAVISSAGSQLISECVHLGVPQFALYDRYDAEQALNVEMLRSAGLGDGVSFAEVTAADLEGFLEATDQGRPKPATWEAPSAAQAVAQLIDSLLA